MTNETTEQNFDKDTIRNMVQKSIYGQVNKKNTERELSENIGNGPWTVVVSGAIEDYDPEVAYDESELERIMHRAFREDGHNPTIALVWDGVKDQREIETTPPLYRLSYNPSRGISWTDG